jgi:RNA polymerase sigma factor (sigma-70 family)
MVLGVCRRVLRNDTDADDAFQATFVVLVRKAASIRPRARLANWLYGVAHKTALKAKAMNARRRTKERTAGAVATQRAPDNTWASLLDVLDEELTALPEIYRTAIVLCDLEGLSYRDAADRLSCPQGTLSGRLTRARVLLARRLARHGLTLSAGALTSLLAGRAAAAIAPSLLTTTLRAGTLLAAGDTLPADVVSAKVIAIAEGVMKMMLLSKLRIVSGALLFLSMAIVAGWLHAGAAAPAPVPKTGAAAQETTSQEAEFVFLSRAGNGKSVSVVVAGTSAPVLNLHVTNDLRVLVAGRSVGLGHLKPGARVLLRMDATNQAVREIRPLTDARPMEVVASNAKSEDLQAPTIAEILRQLPPVARTVPYICETFRGDIDYTIERVRHKIDPVRFFPGVGQARLHHCQWKCTAYFTETVESQFPFAFRTGRRRVEVVYIDREYLVPSK